jgi:hypothetical protein
MLKRIQHDREIDASLAMLVSRFSPGIFAKNLAYRYQGSFCFHQEFYILQKQDSF